LLAGKGIGDGNGKSKSNGNGKSNSESGSGFRDAPGGVGTVLPSRRRLGVQSDAGQCLASNAPSPLEAHVAPSTALMVPPTHPHRPAHGWPVRVERSTALAV